MRQWLDCRPRITASNILGSAATQPALSRFPNFAEFVEDEGDPAAPMRLRGPESISRPLDDERFIATSIPRTCCAIEPGNPSRTLVERLARGNWNSVHCHGIPAFETLKLDDLKVGSR